MKSLSALTAGLTAKELGRLRNDAASDDGTKWGLAASTHSKLRDRGLLECVDIGRASLRAVATPLGCQVLAASAKSGES